MTHCGKYARTCLANDTRISFVFLHVVGDVLPELLEDMCAASEVKSSKFRVSNGLKMIHINMRAWIIRRYVPVERHPLAVLAQIG